MLRTIAYASDESRLLTAEERTLLAFDATTGAPLWRLELPRVIAGVVFAAPNVFAPEPGASPWRSGLSGSAAIAVDVDGALHLIDASVGRLVRSTERYGVPVAIASAGDAFALGAPDCVYVWRDGARSEVPIVASALAFAGDGTLAIGTKKGAVTIGAEPARQLDAHVFALAWSERTGWLAGTDRGLVAVERGKALLEGRVRALAIDPVAERVAIPRGDQTVMTYGWPIGETALAKVTLKRRVIQDVAFGPNGRLGVGVNRGDAGIVDVVEQTGFAVARDPGRDAPSWRLDVGIDPALLPPPAPARASYAKFGFGGLSALAIGLRLVLVLTRTSSPAAVSTPPLDLRRALSCDVSCESSRLAELRQSCAQARFFDCNAEAEEAERAFLASDCDGTRAAIAKIENKVMAGGSEGVNGVLPRLLVAKRGLDLACTETIADGVVELDGLDLRPRQIELRSSNAGNGGRPFAVAIDDADRTFVTVVNHELRECEVWRVSDPMDFEPLADDCTSAELFHRGAETYVAAGRAVKRYDGQAWTDLAWRGAAALRITGTPAPNGDLWITTTRNELARYHAGKWTRESLPSSDLFLGALAFADDTLLLAATKASDGHHLLLRRDKAGTWATTASAFEVDPLYVGRDQNVFAARGSEVAISSDNGATWPTTRAAPYRIAVFLQSSASELYVGGAQGLTRWDGHYWQKTGFGQPLVALAGGGHKLVGIVSHEP